jgi:hypothetical protein
MQLSRHGPDPLRQRASGCRCGMLPQLIIQMACYVSTMKIRAVRSALTLTLAISAVSCGDDDSDNLGELGAPCIEDKDCRPELVCDIHDGRGSCQKPHGHCGALERAARPSPPASVVPVAATVRRDARDR